MRTLSLTGGQRNPVLNRRAGIGRYFDPLSGGASPPLIPQELEGFLTNIAFAFAPARYLVHARFFAVLQVSAKDDYNTAVSALIAYGGDLSGSRTTGFTLECAGDDGLQASLDAQDYIDAPTYGLQVRYWPYSNQQKGDSVSVSVSPEATHSAVAVYTQVLKPAYLNVYARNGCARCTPFEGARDLHLRSSEELGDDSPFGHRAVRSGSPEGPRASIHRSIGG